MISPVSASLALGMVYNGADNETKFAFDEVFNYGDASLEEVNGINQSLINYLTENVSGTQFSIANSLWMNQDYSFHNNFISLNRKYYDAEVENLDFADPNTLKKINNWVSDKTQKKIPTILESIDQGTVLYAINALYFKSDWKYTFKEENTKNLPFHPEGSSAKSVPMMNMTENLSFMSNSIFSSVKLPYKNDKFSMTVFLPNEDKTLNDVIEVLVENDKTNWESQYTIQNVNLSLPKFTFSYKKEFNDALINMGLGIAFSDAADFSLMSAARTQISFVLQKTFIEVNEKGTEAAAATAVGVMTTSAGPSENRLLIDRPFLFIITENTTNAICFMGKVGMPEIE
jgi:serpin B